MFQMNVMSYCLNSSTRHSSSKSCIPTSLAWYAYNQGVVTSCYLTEFLGTSAALNAWHAVGNTTLNVIGDPTPVSSALPNSLQVNFPAGSNVGFSNEGFWGK